MFSVNLVYYFDVGLGSALVGLNFGLCINPLKPSCELQ